ncbi:MAG: hypothetical protein LBQ50_02335 [Planctomycetaceae bacterium]|jgi:hypothetical protein|nr:hypothetical protein [Planctomycetaceae bacterium]
MTTSESQTAVTLFSRFRKEYNCAQAVAKAFGRDDLLEPLKSCGGGKAPHGLCGALHAALLLLPESEHETMKNRFQNSAGNLLCKPMRKKGETKCIDCVRLAAEILEELKMEN